jgi:[amino group carrier protein]-lysine/ornithine hydrolase
MKGDYPSWLIERMVRIPSVSGSEEALADFLATQMSLLGFRSHVDEAGNVIGERGEGRPQIMLLGHLDTVPGDIPVRRDGHRLWGRGAVDAKGALAAAICASALETVPGTVVIVGAVGEETPCSPGAQHLLETRPAPDAAVILEPTGWAGMALGYKGRVGVSYKVDRPMTHTSSPEDKAIEVAVDFWTAVRAHLASSSAAAGLFDSVTTALTRLEGDITHASAEICCRIPVTFDRDAFAALLARESRGGRAVVEHWTPAVRQSRDNPVAQALTRAIRSRGGSPRLQVKAGTSDMNTISPRWRMPMTAYGPGDSHLDHTPDEHLDLDEYNRSVEVLREALPSIADSVSAADTDPEDEDETLVTERLRSLGYLA